MNDLRTKNLFVYCRIVISLSLLCLLIWFMRENLRQIGKILLTVNCPLFIISWFMFFAGIILQAYRLKLVLAAQNIHLVLKDVARLTFIGLFFNNFLPTCVGGDMVKAYYASGASNKRVESFASVFMDRMLGLVTLMGLAVAAVVIRGRHIENRAIIIVVFIMFLISSLFLLFIFNREFARRLVFAKAILRKFKVEEKAQSLYRATNKYRDHKGLILKVLGISFIAQMFHLFLVHLLTIGISARVSIILLLLTLPVISTVSMLPSLNGLGIREGAFVYFLGGIMGPENAFALSLLWLAIYLSNSLLGGAIYMFQGGYSHTRYK